MRERLIMKIITDSFKALDAMDYAKSEGLTMILKANTITVKQRFIPKMMVFQIRLKSLDIDTVKYLKETYFPNLNHS